MKTTVGVVGPKLSIDLIMAIGKEFTTQLELIRHEYKLLNEVEGIVSNHMQDIDVWLFSGQIPYCRAMRVTSPHDALFIPTNSSSLAKVLLQIYASENRKLTRFSIDCLTEEDLQDVIADCDLKIERLRSLPFSAERSLDDYTLFHARLYQQREVDVCITSITRVYQNLTDLGIPVYRMYPTRYSVRQMLSIIAQKGQAIQFMKSQIAIHVIQVEGFGLDTDKHITTYEEHRVDLKLRDIMLTYTEDLLGSFVYSGGGMFVIFSNRGSIDGRHDRAVQLQRDIKLMTNFDSNIGIGYGTTALFAKKNARLALHHARQQTTPSVMLVDDEGNISGPLHTPGSLSYQTRTTDERLAKKLQEVGVSISTYARLAALQDGMQQRALTANNVSEGLSMTPRNARRILNLLERHNLATAIGQEAFLDKGRPSKLYRVRTGIDTSVE